MIILAIWLITGVLVDFSVIYLIFKVNKKKWDYWKYIDEYKCCPWFAHLAIILVPFLAISAYSDMTDGN